MGDMPQWEMSKMMELSRVRVMEMRCRVMPRMMMKVGCRVLREMMGMVMVMMFRRVLRVVMYETRCKVMELSRVRVVEMRCKVMPKMMTKVGCRVLREVMGMVMMMLRMMTKVGCEVMMFVRGCMKMIIVMAAEMMMKHRVAVMIVYVMVVMMDKMIGRGMIRGCTAQVR